MEEKKNKKAIIGIISAVVVLIIIGIIIFFIVNAQKLKFYNSTLELGQENYIEELLKEENVYIEDGYTYSVKNNQIDINNIGTYKITFEIKGKGKTSEEIKKVKVQDTTPPTVELKEDTFFVGDSINVEEIVSIKDLSQAEEIAYSNAKVQVDGQFDTSKEGESSVYITVEDKSGNRGTQAITIKVEKPIVTLYDYVNKKLENSKIYKLSSVDNHIVIRFDPCSYDLHKYNDRWIDFTDKVKYEFETISTKEHSMTNAVGTSYLSYFDNNGIITKAYQDRISNFKASIDEIELSEFENRSGFKGLGISDVDAIHLLLNSNMDKVLNDKNSELVINDLKINLLGKTIKQLKNETIDLRELQ